MAINFAFKILWLAPGFLKYFFFSKHVEQEGGWDILGIGGGGTRI